VREDFLYLNPKKNLAAHRKFGKISGQREKSGNFFSENLYTHSPAKKNYSPPLKKTEKPDKTPNSPTWTQ